MRRQKAVYPDKRSMNLLYKADRTTKPTTVALYAIFALVCVLGLAKFMVYDLWAETRQAQQALAAEEELRNRVMQELADYNEVRERYSRYSATDEERALIDRMEVLTLLDRAVGTAASMDTVSISGDEVQVQFSGATLAQTAQIVRNLEASPIVASTTVNTASTTQTEGTPADASAPIKASVLIQLTKEVSAE